MTKIKKYVFLLLTIIFIVVGSFMLAQAKYNYHGFYFKNSIKLNFVLDQNFSQQSREGFIFSCGQWNSATGYDLLGASSNKNVTTTFPAKDGKPTVYREATTYPFPGRTQPYTSDNNTTSGYIVEADILINISQPFINSTTPPKGYFDTQTVMIHELGHVLGLDHPDSEYSSVMNPRLEGGVAVRYLTNGDIAAVKTRIIS